MPYKYITCCSAEAHLRPWHIYGCITNSLLFRDILAKKKHQIITIPPRNVEEVIWAIIWQRQISLDVANQC